MLVSHDKSQSLPPALLGVVVEAAGSWGPSCSWHPYAPHITPKPPPLSPSLKLLPQSPTGHNLKTWGAASSCPWPLAEVCPPERAPLDLVLGPTGQCLAFGVLSHFQLSLHVWDLKKLPG